MGPNNRITIRNQPGIRTIVKPDRYLNDIFAQGTDGFLWHKVDDTTIPPKDAEVWGYQGDDIPLHNSCSPVCTPLRVGNAYVGYCFVVTSTSRLYAKATDLDGNWSKLQPLPGIPADSIPLTGVLAVCSRDNAIHLVAQGADLALYWTSMRMPGTYTGSLAPNWTPLSPLGGPRVRGTPRLIETAGGTRILSLIAVDVDGFLWTNTLPFPKTPTDTCGWSGWSKPWFQSDPIVGDKISAVCPAKGFWDMIEISALCEPDRGVRQFEVMNGQWWKEGDVLTVSNAEGGVHGPPGGLPMGYLPAPPAVCEDYFVVVRDWLLRARRTTDENTSATQWSDWNPVARGAFRAGPPIVMMKSFGENETVVYLVECGSGKLGRVVSTDYGTVFGPWERV